MKAISDVHVLLLDIKDNLHDSKQRSALKVS